MSQERTEAVLLRGVDFSETSRIVTFLAPDRGRLTCMAKGVRRKNSPMAGAIDTMNRLEIVYAWKDGRDVQQLYEAAVLDSYGAIKSDLEKSTFAAFPIEVAGKIAHENEPSESLYATLVQGLESLTAWRADVRRHACWQVLQLLVAAGFEPVLDACVDCGRRIETATLEMSRYFGFAWRGGVACAECPADVRLSPGQYECLCALVDSHAECPQTGHSGGIYSIVRNYAARQLETDFRSVRVIDQIFKEK